MPKIARFAVFAVNLPDEDPEWKFAGRAYPVWEACVIGLATEDGTIGYGYAASFTHLGATNAGVQAALETLPLTIGREAFELEATLGLVDRAIKDNRPAKSGIDCALHDLIANFRQAPLHELFGGKVQNRSRYAACWRSKRRRRWRKRRASWSMRGSAA